MISRRIIFKHSDFLTRKYKINKIILYFVFFVSPFCDAATGFLVLNHIIGESSLFTPSQIVKFCITVLLLVQVYKMKNGFPLICLSGGYVVFLEAVSCTFWDTTLYAFLYSFMQFYKVVYLMALYYFLKGLFKTQEISFSMLLEFVINSGLIYGIILLVTTILGINVSTYEKGNFGTKGIFASGNGLSIYLGFTSCLALYSKIKNNSGTLKFIILFISSTMVGTKASIIFLVINLLLVFYYAPFKLKILMILTAVFGFAKLYSLFAKIFDVILFRMRNADSIFTFFASSRDSFVKDAFLEYKTDGLYSLRLFSGSGAFVSFRSHISKMNVFDTLENDFFDVLFMYGCVILFFYVKYIFHYLSMAFFNKNFFLLLIFAGVAGYSCIAGHTLFNSMAGTGLVVVPMLIYTYKKEGRKHNDKESCKTNLQY